MSEDELEMICTLFDLDDLCSILDIEPMHVVRLMLNDGCVTEEDLRDL